jgi:hypothetical protein
MFKLTVRILVLALLMAAPAAAKPAVPAAKPAEREWLVLAYVSAVNERGLDGSAKEMLNQLERHGSTDAVTILARPREGAAGLLFRAKAPTVL